MTLKKSLTTFLHPLNTQFSSKFNFDTYKLVSDLESSGFTRPQSIAIMKTVNAFLVESHLATRKTLLSNWQLEIDQYHHKSKLQDIRNELNSLRQNDANSVKAELEALGREIASLEQTHNDKFLELKSDINLDISNHRQAGMDITADVDLKLQDIDHKAVMKFAELKTAIEAMKIELTTQLVWMTVFTIGSVFALDWVFQAAN